MKKRVLCAILFVVMLLSVMTVSSFAKDSYDVWVNGTRFTTINATAGITCGSGKAYYDAETKTITLDNATITSGYNYDSTFYAGIFAKNNVKIELIGKNKIEIPSTTNANGIIARIASGSYGSLSIVEGEGEGSLDIIVAATGRYGIYADTASINADVRICADKMAIGTKTSAATFDASCTAKGNADYKADFSGCTTAVTATANSVKVSGSDAKTLVVKKGYDVYVNGEEFAANKLSVTCGSGTAALDVSTTPYTLTLTDAAITKTVTIDGAEYGIWSNKDLKIVLASDSSIDLSEATVNGAWAQGIFVNGTLTFFGADKTFSVNANNKNGVGIFAGTIDIGDIKELYATGPNYAIGSLNDLANATKYGVRGATTVETASASLTSTAALSTTNYRFKVEDNDAKSAKIAPLYTVYIDLYENESSTACKRLTYQGVEGETVDYTKAIADATEFFETKYGTGTAKFFTFEMAGYKKGDGKYPATFGAANGGFNNYKRWTKMYVDTTLTIHADVYENGTKTGKRFTLTQVYGSAFDQDALKADVAAYLEETYGTGTAKYFSIDVCGYNAEDHNLPETFGQSGYNWHADNNKYLWINVYTDTTLTIYADVYENGTKTGKRFTLTEVYGTAFDQDALKADVAAYLEETYGTGSSKYFFIDVCGYNAEDHNLPATFGQSGYNWHADNNKYLWINVYTDTTLTIHADVIENGEKTGKRFTMTEVYGTTVDYDTLKANVAAYLEGIYGTGTAKYFDIEVHGYNETDNKLPTTFGQDGINWHSTNNKYLWINVYTKTLFTVHVDLFENANEDPDTRFTVTGKIGEDIDFDAIMAQGVAFLDEKYGEGASQYFGLYFSIYNLENTKGVPTGFGEEGKNWHGNDNRTIWLRLNADTEFTFIGVLYDNGTKINKQYKVTGLFGETIDYDAVEAWARAYAKETYPDVEEAHTYVEFKLPGKTNLPATIGDPAVNWHDPDKCWVNVILTCEYAVNYTIDGSLNKTDYVKIEDFDEYTLYAPTERRGYTFTGWYEAPADIDDDQKSAVTAPVEAKLWNLYSRFDINTYNITYVMGDDNSVSKATNAGTNPATYTVLDSVTFADPSRVGYTFEGWYTDDTFTTPVTGIEVGTIDDVTVYAKWTVIVYNISYVLNVEDWSVSPAFHNNVATYTVEKAVVLADAERRGYTFLGWYEEDTLDTLTTGFGTLTTGDKTFYADWSINIYKIRYILAGGKNVKENPTTYTVEDSIIYLIPASKAYNSFRGWYDAESRALKPFIPAHSIGDVTVMASWTESTLLSDIPTGLGVMDVTTADWSYSNIAFVLSKGYMDPTSATSFSPKASTKRADVVYALWMMEGAPVVNYAMSFKDIEIGSKYLEAIRWAASEKIALGMSETEFAPNETVTREQFATFLYRYAQKKGAAAESAELTFSDKASISDWAVEAVKWCVKKGIIIGRNDGTFDSQALCKREEAAAMISRFASELNK